MVYACSVRLGGDVMVELIVDFVKQPCSCVLQSPSLVRHWSLYPRARISSHTSFA